MHSTPHNRPPLRDDRNGLGGPTRIFLLIALAAAVTFLVTGYLNERAAELVVAGFAGAIVILLLQDTPAIGRRR